MPKATKSATPAKKRAASGRPDGAGAKASPASRAKPKASPASRAKPKAKAAPRKAGAATVKAATVKAAPVAKPARRPAARKAPADKFVAEQHTQLLAERETYVRHAESLKAEAEQLAQEMEPGDVQFDEESGEGATINIERERDLALSAQARGAVEEIDRALARIDAGTYGTCERCGEPIPKARLKVLPYAALCVACKSGGLSRR